MPAAAFFVGSAAAVIWGLQIPVPADRSVAVEVAVPYPHRSPRARGIRGRQMRPHLAQVTFVEGLRVATPPVAWASLAMQLPHRGLVAVADGVLRVDRMPGTNRVVRPALAGVDELHAVIGRRPGHRRLTSALADARVGSASTPETHLRLALVDAGMPEPDLDADVFDPAGRLIGCSEMLFRRFDVAVEYEGDHHRRSRSQWNRDIDKYADYAAAGIDVVRVTADHLYPAASRAVERVRGAMLRAGWRPSGH